MAVQGDVSLMFVMDDTGSMGGEIEAVKSMAIDIMNYDRQAPIISYILSPFNDPYPSGKSQIHDWTNPVRSMLSIQDRLGFYISTLWIPHFSDSRF